MQISKRLALSCLTLSACSTAPVAVTPTPLPVAEPIIVSSPANGREIESLLVQHRGDFRDCYTQANTKAAGVVDTLFVIGPAGKVETANVLDSSLHEPRVEECVRKVLKAIRFPKPIGGGTIEVQKKFRYAP